MAKLGAGPSPVDPLGIGLVVRHRILRSGTCGELASAVHAVADVRQCFDAAGPMGARVAAGLVDSALYARAANRLDVGAGRFDFPVEYEPVPRRRLVCMDIGVRHTLWRALLDASERLHGLGLWLLVPVLAPQLADAIFRGLFGFTLDFGWFDLGPLGMMHPNTPGVWTAMSWGLIPVLLLSWVGFARHWPFAERFGYASIYRGWVALGLAMFLLAWMFIVNGPWVTDPVMGAGWAQPAQIGYLPLFNALDFVSALALFALWRHGRLTGAYFLNYAGERTQQVLHWLMGAAAFVWLNAMIARSLNAAGLPLDDGRFLHEALAQTTYSIAWSLLGLILIVLASRLKQRRLWLVAAGLLGVVVLKLFLVDLSGSDTLARIISFVGVGVLLLLAGYIAPIPAKQSSSINADQNTDDSEQKAD
ncbi:MAG: hypothetical protein B7X28_08550 [Halothiobacillus sp. 13-55-253]|nr:MAG: hypothetical protein B7X28_08550 [Halothiobacillus sp. 13-55-253]